MGPSKALQVVSFFNTPVVKERMKKLFGSANFAIGIVDVFFCSKENPIETLDQGTWEKTAHKIVIILAKVSILLSYLSSYPSLVIFSAVTKRFFSNIQLERAFGPNTTFQKNPLHPKHVVSIAGTLLGLPSILYSVYLGSTYLCQKLLGKAKKNTKPTKTELLVFFKTVFDRPTLHIVNRVCRFILN